MKRIKVKVIALILVVAMALTGCMTVQEDMRINSDGSGTMSMTMTMDKEAYIKTMLETYKQMSEMMGEKFNEAQARKEIEASAVEGGYKEVVIDGKKCYQVVENQKFKKGELTSDGTSTDYITGDTVYLKITAEDVISVKEMVDAYGADASAIKDIDMTVSVQFVNKVVATNGTIDPNNPNKAVFKVALDKPATLFATTKKGVSTQTVVDTIKKSNKISKPGIKFLRANRVKAKAKRATVTLKIRKVSGAKGYEIQYSTKKNFKGAKIKNIKKKTTYTIKNLRKGKKYYVRVRAYKKNYTGVKVTSKWVKKTVKTKNNKK